MDEHSKNLAPHPLSWDEQDRLFRELPAHLQRMALFKVNTGTREGEVCGLRWDWEIAIPELASSVFAIPGSKVKKRRGQVGGGVHVSRTWCWAHV